MMKKEKNKGSGATSSSDPSANGIDEKTKQLLLKRDSKFLEELFREVNPYLVRVCIANQIFSQDIEEIVHQTWETFLSNIERFEGRSQIRTFICGILFNKVREFRRERGRTVYEDDSEKVIDRAFTSEGWWNVAPSDPRKLAEVKQIVEFVNDCLESLSEQQKTAFLMREVEEEESDDICNVLGVTVSHLRVLLFRAKDKLRKCIEGKAGIDGGQVDAI